MEVTRERIIEVLSGIKDPESQKDLVRLGAIKNLKVSPGTVSFTVMIQDPMSAFGRSVEQTCRDAVQSAVGEGVMVKVDSDSEMIALGDDLQVSSGGRKEVKLPAGVRNYIAVASGKGGVGKSTVAVNLAVSLARAGYDVGLVDTDIHGPSIPIMFGVSEKPRVNENRKIVPLEKYGVKILSMGMLVDPGQATIWRGPMVSSAVRQFLGDTDWGELDFLVLDLPPGTGDIQLTIVQTIPLTGAVIVSTPQEVALIDARKGVGMFGSVKVPVLGVVENMSFFSPPDLPDRKYYLFGRGGARRLAGDLAVPFLGEVPIEESVREGGDYGRPVVVSEPDSVSARAFKALGEEVVRQVNIRNSELPPSRPIEILHR